MPYQECQGQLCLADGLVYHHKVVPGRFGARSSLLSTTSQKEEDYPKKQEYTESGSSKEVIFATKESRLAQRVNKPFGRRVPHPAQMLVARPCTQTPESQAPMVDCWLKCRIINPCFFGLAKRLESRLVK